MNAMEQVAWTELLIAFVTIVVVTVLYPWLGSGAAGGFGLLGLLGFSGVWFARRRGQSVVVDERDREIERSATRWGVESAWMVLFLALIAIVLWNTCHDAEFVSTGLLMWLVWIQFAICYGVKGLVGVVAYRRQNRAA